MSKTKEVVDAIALPKDDAQIEFEQQLTESQNEAVDEIPKESLLEALMKFQTECPCFTKNTQGYGYKYVDLGSIVDTITPILNKNGLGVIQPLTDEGIRTILYHAPTGESLESHCIIPKNVNLRGMNEFQAYGSAITYFRRYSLCSFLNIISDKDLDASGEQTDASGLSKSEKYPKSFKTEINK